jgi:hypothetical protein
VPFVEDWEKALPLKIREDNPLWKRMLEFYRKAVAKMAGKMLVSLPDFHTNMDLLAAIRGPEKLCIDLIDRPEVIDEAMKSARQVFPVVWNAVTKVGWTSWGISSAYIQWKALLCCNAIFQQ